MHAEFIILTPGHAELPTRQAVTLHAHASSSTCVQNELLISNVCVEMGAHADLFSRGAPGYARL